MKITSKGQVTIPLAVRQATGLLPDCEVDFEIKGDRVFLRKIGGRMSRGEQVVRRLRGRGTVRMTTDEIMSLTRSE
jgi:AbrB family looped-hinge helix DNA binding protein